MEKKKGGGEWDAQCLDNRDPGASHLTPHAPFIPLDFLLQNGLQCDLAHDIPGRRLGGGSSCGHEGDWGSGERVGGGVGGRGGWARCAALSKGSAFWWVPVMSRAAICNDRHVGFVVYLQHRFRVYTRTMTLPNGPVPRTS